MKRCLVLLGLILGLESATLPCAQADVDLRPYFKTILTTAVYGAAVGTAVGLVTWPLTGEVRSVFMGASVGMYMGLLVGTWHVFNLDNPDNPLTIRRAPSFGPSLNLVHFNF